MNENGIGMRINLEKAIEYYEKAAELDEPTALYKLGKLY
jgi:TPR repeat protein